MTIRSPGRWLDIARLIAARGQMSSNEVADELGVSRQSISHNCSAMARHGYLEVVGYNRRTKSNPSPSTIYICTPAGRDMEVPPPADPRVRQHSNPAPFGLGVCALAEALGYARR